MYYRNANCAVVVYDITQAVCTPFHFSQLDFTNVDQVVLRQGQGMGEGTSETGEWEYYNRFSWEQGRFGSRISWQAGNCESRRRSLRKGSWPSFLRNLCKDLRERSRSFHGHRPKITTRASRCTQLEAQPSPGDGSSSSARGSHDESRGWFL